MVGAFPAMIALGIAAVLEIGAYYIPWIDNLLETAAVHLAAIAITGVIAASLTDISPMLTWSFSYDAVFSNLRSGNRDILCWIDFILLV
ncbi:MAG: hypothetical protein ACI9O4_000217 [Chitinophagales bacterium]